MEKVHQADGTRFTVPLLTINTSSPLTQRKSELDWLRLSGSPLLADVAAKIQAGQPIDMAALESHMPTQEQWLVVKRRISTIEIQRNSGSPGDPDMESSTLTLTGTGRQPSRDSLMPGSPENSVPHGVAQTGLEAYPEFYLRDDPLGHAFIPDFSADDLSRLRVLAHLELAAQYEKCGLSPTFVSPKIELSAALPLSPKSPLSPQSPLTPQSPPPQSPTTAKPSKRAKRKTSGRCGNTSAAGNVVTEDSIGGSSGSGGGGVSGGGGCWFGVPLEAVLASERIKLGSTESLVPRLVTALASRVINSGLQEEGILRVSGSHQAIRQLRLHVEANGPVGQPLEEADAHDAGGLLKAFLRELPQPLLGGPYIEYYRMLERLPTVQQRLIGLNLLVVLLPTSACLTLREIVNLLGRVLDNAQSNRMTLRAVATVMTPNLLPAELTFSLGESERLAGIIEMLIKYREIAWRVPRTLIRQLRYSGPDQLCALFTGLPADGTPLQRRGQARFAPSQPPTELPLDCSFTDAPRQMSVEPDETVLELLNRLRVSEPTASKLCAYEVGGNIKERRLPEQTRLRDLLAVNPGLKLVIKWSP